MDQNILAMLLRSIAPAAASRGPAPPWVEPILEDRSDQYPVAPGAIPASSIPRGSPLDSNLAADTPVETAPQELPNVLQSLAESTGPDPRALVQSFPEALTEKPRPRRSLLDTVGGIADALATAGGHPAQYQAGLDAREDRETLRGTQDMARTLTQQQIEAGEDTAEGRQRAVIGQAVRGLQAIQRRGGDINVAWPMLAERVGIPPDQAAELGRLFASDPNAVAGVAAALNEPGRFSMSPTLGRDAAGNVSLYQLNSEGGAVPVDLGDGITPVDPINFVDTGSAQVGVGRNSGRPTIILPKTERPGQAADRNSRREIARGNQAGRAREGAAGRRSREEIAAANRDLRREIENSPLTRTQRGAVRQVQESVPGILRTLQRVEHLSGQLGTASGAIGGRIPGQLAGGSAAQFDRAQAILAAQIRGLIRVAGEGSMSDFESRLNIATLPARTDAPEGRTEAIRGLRTLLREVQARSRRLLGNGQSSSRPAAPRGQRSAPRGNSRSSGGWTVTRM